QRRDEVADLIEKATVRVHETDAPFSGYRSIRIDQSAQQLHAVAVLRFEVAVRDMFVVEHVHIAKTLPHRRFGRVIPPVPRPSYAFPATRVATGRIAVVFVMDVVVSSW